MRRFMVHLVTEIDFKDGDEASDEAARNYEKISGSCSERGPGAIAPTIKDVPVESVSVAEIKAEL